MESNVQEDVITTISPNDEMFEPSDYGVQHYFAVGVSALENIRAALALADQANVERILDLPCGHGRVMRTMKAAFPGVAIHACDLNRDGVDFCARTFGARPVYSSPNFADIRLDTSFDLIWSGSLLTHLNKKPFVACIEFCIDHLEDHGVFVFSVHGRYSIWSQEHRYKYLSDERFARIASEYNRDGFGYADYDDHSGYGISVAKPSWLFSVLEAYTNIRVVLFRERGWDNHQDVVACVRMPITGG